MKYLFVFLLVGLVSCGDASSNASENVKPKLKEYSMDEVTTPNDTMFLKKDMKPVTGIVRAWYENGQLYQKRNYIDGLDDGLQRAWHENGQLALEANFKDDKLISNRLWYEDGQLEYECNWKDGKLINEKCWNEDGTLKECEYKQ